MKPDIKLLAVDLDGTLLNSARQVSKENLSALNRVARAGIEVVPITGRPPLGIIHMLEGVIGFHILAGHNGAFVYDIRKKTVLESKVVTKEEALPLIELARRMKIYFSYHVGLDWYVESQDETFESERSANQMVPIISDDILRVAPPVANKICLIDLNNFDHLLEFQAEALKLAPNLNVMVSSNVSLEITHKNATKGAALRFIANHLGIRANQIMAVGDSENDVTMIEYAGVGVAMGNAEEQIIRIADLVVANNDEDGVADAVNRVIFSGCVCYS